MQELGNMNSHTFDPHLFIPEISFSTSAHSSESKEQGENKRIYNSIRNSTNLVLYNQDYVMDLDLPYSSPHLTNRSEDTGVAKETGRRRRRLSIETSRSDHEQHQRQDMKQSQHSCKYDFQGHDRPITTKYLDDASGVLFVNVESELDVWKRLQRERKEI